jgi:hypothetical protein
LATAPLTATIRAQAPGDEAQVKAAFVYNFIKFVNWPAEVIQHSGDSIVVAVIGDGDVADAAEHLLTGKQVGDRRVVVRRLKSDQSLAGVHAVFVTESDAKKVRRILDGATGRAILSVGDASGFASSGGIIGLVIEDRKVRFEIDQDAADSAGLKISSKLLALSRVVHSKTKPGDRP